MNMYKEIIDAITKVNAFDGSYYELVFDAVNVCNGSYEAVRVFKDGMAIFVHLLDKNEETTFVHFADLCEDDQIAIYKSIFGIEK